ncbi:hypothetical protein Zmor_027927 [Zophobas morio]|uniref:RNA-directed DNA polymerase n=1 Tax=Zophobas morio TaxID=2755281 RepID=A0AA38HQ21_9CUCU|nr:hypothetical protein Zmor_027927 [Zophobas morio]
MEILSADLDMGMCRALIEVTIAGKHGLAFLDTGAKHTIAGYRLYQHLCEAGLASRKVEQVMTLADGEPRRVITQVFDVEISLEGPATRIPIVGLPDHVNGKTLLGVDFVKAANIILDLPGMQWRFRTVQTTWFPLHSEKAVPHVLVNTVSVEPLKYDEGTSLCEQEKFRLSILLDQNKTAFERYEDPTPYAEHCINLTDDVPIATPPYRLSPQRREALQVEIQKMLDDRVIEECESPYAAPVVMVPKRDGTHRVCVDYRKLNHVTVPDRYPLPRIDDVVYAAKRNFYMSTIDLKSGFWQVPVRIEDREKTAFITPFGLYRFIRMPFGLRNSPATFQRLMDRFKTGVPGVCLLVCMDDLIILSETFEEHLSDLEKVFERLRQFRLSANRKKSVFARAAVKFLGHVISTGGISADPDKVSAIVYMQPPSNIKQLVSFLQTCSWFRRFIPEFSNVARPLTTLTKKKAQWTWGAAQEEAFDKLKRLLAMAPILRQADPTMPYILKTDASSFALGACLLQGEGADERLVEYASRLLTSAEQNYTTTEKQALAIVFGVQ